MTILVTGGAGYIGSVMVKQLLEKGHQVVVYDDLSNGHHDSIDSRAVFIEGNLLAKELLDSIFEKQKIDAVMHFAGVISMGESMADPGKYFSINTAATLNLLEAMTKIGVKYIIFSSTAGVYGNPTKVPIPEEHPKNPTNPYGESKLMIEKLLYWYDISYGIKSVCLRYFNACGASLDGTLGEQHKNESHLIPLALQAALTDSPFTLFGTDYDTPDGTCIRDYIHIEDLCDAHLQTLEYLQKTNMSNIFNVGTGIGISNREILDNIQRLTGKTIQIVNEKRRPGDADKLIADPTHITKTTSWKPRYSSIEQIITSAFTFQKKQLVKQNA